MMPFRLGDEEVVGRHVLMLVDGDGEADGLLRRFVVDGFADAGREVHVVAPPNRARHLEWLASNGLDVGALIDAGRLDVQTPGDGLVIDGRYERGRALAWLRRNLTGGAGGPSSSTRMLLDMRWATEAVIDPGGLIAFERGLGHLVDGSPAIVVCRYDVKELGPARVADVLVAHPIAMVRGKLGPSKQTETPLDARERILATAGRLFHDNGIRATGIDSLIVQAGVAKATFYHHFASKDDLVEAWLRHPRTRWFDHVRAQAEASGPAPRDEILLFFEGVAEWLQTDGFRGCPYANTAVEITDPAHPARQIVREYLEEIGAYFRDLLASAGYVESDVLGPELEALLAGSIALAGARQTDGFALAAADAVQRLLDGAERRPKGRANASPDGGLIPARAGEATPARR
jgi:AcrR family transcriptional regulator